jgi:hypothetical protein
LPGAHRQSGNGARLSRASPSTPEDGRRRSRRLPREVGHWVSVSPAEGKRCFPCHSPTLRPWIGEPRAAHRLRGCRPTWRGFGARASMLWLEKRRTKQNA